MFDLFSLENDSELDQIDVSNSEIVNDKTAVDAEPQKPVEVSISESQAAHNEAASAGGCVVGDNEEQLTMDPVAAEESYILGRFGLSAEELEEIVDETIKEGDEIEAKDQAQADVDNDLEVTAVAEETTIVTPETTEPETTNDGGDDISPVVEGPFATEEEIAEASSEGLQIQSIEKFFGYFRMKDFKVQDRKKGQNKYDLPSDPVNFLKSKIGQSKFKDLEADFEKKGWKFATEQDIRTQKDSLFAKLTAIRPGGERSGIGKLIMGVNKKISNFKNVKINGKIFSVFDSGNGENVCCYAIALKPNGRVTPYLYAVVPSKRQYEMVDLDKKSKESLDDMYAYAFGL